MTKAAGGKCAAGMLALGVMFSSVLIAPALACNAPPPKGTDAEQAQAAYDGADFVFVAKLRSRSLTLPLSPLEWLHERAQLVVLEVFKGDLLVGQPVVFYTDVQNCGVSLINDPMWIVNIDYAEAPVRATPVSDTWLLFVNGREPFSLSINNYRSKPVNLVRGDIDYLRKMPRRLPRTWKSTLYR
jgi:hypothetical protein